MEIELNRAVGLLDYLARVAWMDGEEIIITKKGKPYLKLVAHPEGDVGEVHRKPIPVGLPEGKVWISPEYFEEDTEIIDAFEGKYSNDSLFEPFLVDPDSREGQANDSNASLETN